MHLVAWATQRADDASAVSGRTGVVVAGHSIQVRRVYEAPKRGDGYRVLVDRLWPRGVSKDEARLDEWCKQAAPSTELRKWYGHDPQRFGDFRRRYRAELRQPAAANPVEHLRCLATRRNVTLLTATKDLDISGASVLAELLSQ
jgi:uncharacterized protein YeaO (DUF488 family)